MTRTALAATALTAALAALTTAGCGTTHAAAPPRNPGQPSQGKGGVSAPSLTPRQRAEHDAAGILRSFAVPPGARRVESAPLISGGALKQRTPGLEPLSADMFSLPPVAGVLDSRQLIVEVVGDGAGTAVRVDAQVIWLPTRPASEHVPARATAVTIAMDIGMNQGSRKPPAPVTITDPAKVSKLAALINGLPRTTGEIYSCPADFGDSLTLTFRAGPQGPSLAVATVDLSGCEGVALTVGGQPQPALQGGIGPQVLKTAGLAWTIPTL